MSHRERVGDTPVTPTGNSDIRDIGDLPVKRDRWDRPLIPHPDSGEVIAYTRASTLSNAIEDQFNLSLWKQRQVATGLAQRADLIAKVLAKSGDKEEMNRIVRDAAEIAGSSKGANLGTAIHEFTQMLDEGKSLPTGVDERIWDSLDAYEKACQKFQLEIVGIELFVAAIEIQAAGTLDRIVKHEGKLYIADIKTGVDAPKYAHGASVQMSVYAHGRRYSEGKGWGTDLTQYVEQDKGLLIHLPATGDPICGVYWIDLATGWQMAKIATEVRKWWKSSPTTLIA